VSLFSTKAVILCPLVSGGGQISLMLRFLVLVQWVAAESSTSDPIWVKLGVKETSELLSLSYRSAACCWAVIVAWT